MFCKYCGQKIPEDSASCPVCGKKLKKEALRKGKERQTTGAAFVLMLLMLCSSTVLAWGRVLGFGFNIHIGMVSTTVMLAAGLALLGTLVGRGRIRASDYRLSDLLVLCCVWIVVPDLLLRLKTYLVAWFEGGYAPIVYWKMESDVTPVIQFPAFWLVLGLIALGLGRRGNWEPTQKLKLTLLAALALRSVLGLVLTSPFVTAMDTPVEIMEMLTRTVRMWSALCWLWPLVILQLFRRLGNGEIGPVGAAASMVGMQLGELLLMTVLMAGRFGMPRFGLIGYAMAKGLAPLLGLLFLSVAACSHEKETDGADAVP